MKPFFKSLHSLVYGNVILFTFVDYVEEEIDNAKVVIHYFFK